MEINSIGWYLDKAKEKQGIKSDRQLALHLGLNPTAVSFYRVGKAYPSDPVMLRIARAGGQSDMVAIAELHYWTNFDNPAADTFQRMIDVVKKGGQAAAIAIAFASMGLVDFEPSATAEEPAKVRHESARMLYIMGNMWCRRLWARLSRFTINLLIPSMVCSAACNHNHYCK